MSSPEIRQIVAEVYTGHDLLPPQWTARQQRAFLDAEAARLSHQVAELAAGLSAHAIEQWTARAGHHPDVMTKVGLINTAAMQAKEIVLTRELYDLIPPTPEDLDDTPSVPPDRSELAWNRRWTHTTSARPAAPNRSKPRRSGFSKPCSATPLHRGPASTSTQWGWPGPPFSSGACPAATLRHRSPGCRQRRAASSSRFSPTGPAALAAARPACRRADTGRHRPIVIGY